MKLVLAIFIYLAGARMDVNFYCFALYSSPNSSYACINGDIGQVF